MAEQAVAATTGRAVAVTNRAQHDGDTLTGVDIAVIDDVASARRPARIGGPEESAFGAVDEGLEAREIQEVGAVEVLCGARIDDEPVERSAVGAGKSEV